IRDFHVTGVQTCALPICRRRPRRAPWRGPAAGRAGPTCGRTGSTLHLREVGDRGGAGRRCPARTAAGQRAVAAASSLWKVARSEAPAVYLLVASETALSTAIGLAAPWASDGTMVSRA